MFVNGRRLVSSTHICKERIVFEKNSNEKHQEDEKGKLIYTQNFVIDIFDD